MLICSQVSVVQCCEAEQDGARCWWRERERGVGTARAERCKNCNKIVAKHCNKIVAKNCNKIVPINCNKIEGKSAIVVVLVSVSLLWSVLRWRPSGAEKCALGKIHRKGFLLRTIYISITGLLHNLVILPQIFFAQLLQRRLLSNARIISFR